MTVSILKISTLWDSGICTLKTKLYNSHTDVTPLNNSGFREFQRHGYGRYFPVLSKLHEVEDFQPVCKEYPFAK